LNERWVLLGRPQGLLRDSLHELKGSMNGEGGKTTCTDRSRKIIALIDKGGAKPLESAHQGREKGRQEKEGGFCTLNQASDRKEKGWRTLWSIGENRALLWHGQKNLSPVGHERNKPSPGKGEGQGNPFPEGAKGMYYFHRKQLTLAVYRPRLKKGINGQI